MLLQKSSLQYEMVNWYRIIRYRPEIRPFLRYFWFFYLKNNNNLPFFEISPSPIGLCYVWSETSCYWLIGAEKCRPCTRVLGPEIELRKLITFWFLSFLLLFNTWSTFFEFLDSIFVISDLDLPRIPIIDSIGQFSRKCECSNKFSPDFKFQKFSFSRKLSNRVKNWYTG